MFICNDYQLLTFTYYIKLILSLLMTIVPIIMLEIFFIRCIKHKQKYKVFNPYFIRKSIKYLFYVLTIFVLSFSMHNILNKEDNVCYTYALKDIIIEYKTTYHNLKNSNMSEEESLKKLETTLITAYNTYLKGEQVVIDNNKTEEKIDEKDIIRINNTEIKETLNLNENNDNKQNKVYIQNGVFYYPKYVYGNKNTYSGYNCSSNPSANGYNNPYGYNNYFYTRLIAFIEEAAKNGHKITISTQGCRTYNTQSNYYYSMAKGRAAYPGQSLHGWGIASDLEFYKTNGSVCPYNRTASSCSSMGWAHSNASKFGLTFPLLHASYKEDWHIEPLYKKSY